MKSKDVVPLVQSKLTSSEVPHLKHDPEPNELLGATKQFAKLGMRRKLVGIDIDTFDCPFYARVAEYASSYLMRHGCQAIVQSRSKTKVSEMAAWLSLDLCDCDGFIISPGTLSNEELPSILMQFPNSVLINRYLPNCESKCVYIDNVYGGELAANYLLGMGHTRMAMVTGPRTYFDVQERTAGFEKALRKNKPSLVPSIKIEGDFTIYSGAMALRSIVESNKRVTAIFFHNDAMALGALAQCTAMGINIPGDLSIIGYDDELVCRHTTPQLTSIRQPLRQFGEAAAQLMLRMLSDDPVKENEPPVRTTFKPQLIKRDSVKAVEAIRYSMLLSKREIECLEWIAIGKTSSEVSVLLDLAESTVTFHLRNALKKLGSNNRCHAVNIALKKGVITGNYDRRNLGSVVQN